ncbi:MAG: regulator of (H+)-ATPase in vacuolar membrane [Piccolia ochrophora]|nr:MAG: regulator of (H+)-ATPase in vacuolar membrane [Piccolia ochrophora]
MRAVLPGRPQPNLQAVCTARWAGQRYVAYVTGHALVILTGPHAILQTIYHDSTEPLCAIGLAEDTGKIAVCSDDSVYVYRPHGREEGVLQWTLQCSLPLKRGSGPVKTLSWGTTEELLVGGLSLRLFATADLATELWTKPLSSPVKIAQFSHDASLIASTGAYDRLTKIWRRLAFGSDEVRFDVTYLRHPASVTNLHWRKAAPKDHTIEHVLYTLCADNILRIWATSDPHALQILQPWAQVDLQEAIKPRLAVPLKSSSARYAFFIDNHQFTEATERALEAAPVQRKEHQALDHLKEVARRNPDVCVVLDDRGHMSAWGFERVGCKNCKTSDIFNIAHEEGLNLSFTPGDSPEAGQAQLHCFADGAHNADLTLLTHFFDGRIEWLEGRVETLFDPSPRLHRLVTKATWSGHDTPINKIIRTVAGKHVVTHADTDQLLVWRQVTDTRGTTLIRQSTLDVTKHVHRTCVLDDRSLVVLLHPDSISLWDARSPRAVPVSSLDYTLEGNPLCLIILPELRANAQVIHVATISSEMHGVVWEIPVCDGRSTSDMADTGSNQAALKQFTTFQLDMHSELAFVLPVDPAGALSVVSGFIDVFSRDVAISYTKGGTLHSWTARIDQAGGQVEWLATSTVETGIENPSLASASSIRKAALVDSQRTSLTIWNTRAAQLEFEKRFEAQDVIRDLDWTSTPDNQSVLAVGFPHRVLLLSQLRFDYLNAGPAWATIREIRIREYTPHPIGDSTWLSGGNLVIGAGNQLFVFDKKVDIAGTLVTDLRLPSRQSFSRDLFNVVTRLNGPLPVFHPQFLAQCILRGKTLVVQRIIVELHQSLKFFVDGDELDSFLGLSMQEFCDDDEDLGGVARKELSSSYAQLSLEDAGTVTEELAATLNEKLTKVALPQLSGPEQFHLADIVECVATLEKQRRSMDDNAARFLLFFRQHMLRRGHTAPVDVTWREIAWAFHSGSQDILTDMVSRHFQSKMRWPQARESGMFMWLRDVSTLRAKFDVIARNHYTQTDEKNPIDCSLYYIALRKKNVLLQLWRMASWNREQKSTQRLLANDFGDARWKTAALKNAYALLGRHRFEYAAAFFLLADCLRDAVAVCVNQLGDLQLGITIARVYEGDEGPVLREILEERVLPLAAKEGNRWLATWAFWMLDRRDMAVRALVSPVYTLLDSPASPNLHAKLFLVDDPALVVLYKQLRAKTLQTLRGASKISPKVEWEFVMHNARLYDRMGCDILALDLVRNWEFLRPSPEPKTPLAESPVDPRKMLRRRSSLVVADLPSPKSPTQPRAPPPKVFEEPEASSLLDSFGF